MTDPEEIGYWFTSDLFQIEPGEDQETNPRLYGRQLANWIRQRFIELGYEVEDVVPEDFGWLVLCTRDPYSLGVICVSVEDNDPSPQDAPPPSSQVEWNCRLFVEVPFFKRLFGKVDTAIGGEKLNRELRSILEGEPRIKLR